MFFTKLTVPGILYLYPTTYPTHRTQSGGGLFGVNQEINNAEAGLKETCGVTVRRVGKKVDDMITFFYFYFSSLFSLFFFFILSLSSFLFFFLNSDWLILH